MSEQAESNWRLIEDDALHGLVSFEAESVDCIVTSPPYYWQRDYGFDGQIGHESTIVGYVDALRMVFREAKRVLKRSGTLFLNMGDTYYSAKGKPCGRDDKNKGRMFSRTKLRAVDGPGLGLPRKSLIGIPWRVAIGLQSDGWTLRNDIVWKRSKRLPEPKVKDRAWNVYEHIFVFSKSAKYYFDRDGLHGDEDVWNIDSKPSDGKHAAPFPRELAIRCIECGCPQNGTVLDPFVGSGTSLFAALELKRHAIGIELSSEYCAIIRTALVGATP